MNKNHPVLNAFGIIFAVLFSIVLTVVLVAAPVVLTMTDFMQPKTLQTMITTVDFEDILRSNNSTFAPFAESGISGDMIQDIMGSDAVEDVLDLYVDDIFAVAEGEYTESSLTPDVLNDIFQENKEELLPFAEEFIKNQLGESVELDEEDIEEALETFVDDHGEELISVLPSPDDLGIDADYKDASADGGWNALDILKGLHNGTALWIVTGAIVLLSVLIFLCRWKGFKGFMWLAIIYFIAFLFAMLGFMLVKNFDLLQTAMMPDDLTVISGAMMSIVTGGLMKGMIGLVSFSVIFFVAFFVCRALKKKKPALA